MITLGIIWLVNHPPLKRIEVNETGIHRIYYGEGRAIFYKLLDQGLIELEKGNRSAAKELLESV